MDEFSPSLIKLWKEWNVRVTVLLSLMLQVVLIVLGKRRKHISKLWIRIVTWCAYLSADFVATYALGVITNNISHFHEKNSGSMDANIELTAFWAPFLLLHLGGPDTITAYSMEDNELWLRHFLGLVVQVAMAIYVEVMAWTGSLLSFLSLLMFFAGLIKYGERTWVLRKASLVKFTELQAEHLASTLPHFEDFHGHNLSLAYISQSFLFMPSFLDSNAPQSLDQVFQLVLPSVDLDTFQLIEMSLAFIYNNLYTKALLLYTHVGVGLRVITVILTSSVSVLFPLLIDKHKFSKIDVTITFILLFGAIILEIYSILLVLFSDRFQLWLIKHDLMFEALKGFVPKKERWSNKMSQLSLLSFIMKEKPMPCSNFLKRFSIVNQLEYQRYETDIEVPSELKELILTYLESKKDLDTHSESQDTHSESPSIDVRGMDFTEEIEKSILAWHVATEIWYDMDRKIVQGKGPDIELRCKLICQISRYMFSLLILHTDLVSSENITKLMLPFTLLEAARHSSFASTIEPCEKLKKLLQDVESILFEYARETIGQQASRPRLPFLNEGLPELLRQLSVQDWEERWMIISCTWLEMLAYGAYKCTVMQHAQRLKRGGEFLTHVWFLTKYFGFKEKDFKLHSPSWASSIIGFSDASSSS